MALCDLIFFMQQCYIEELKLPVHNCAQNIRILVSVQNTSMLIIWHQEKCICGTNTHQKLCNWVVYGVRLIILQNKINIILKKLYFLNLKIFFYTFIESVISCLIFWGYYKYIHVIQKNLLLFLLKIINKIAKFSFFNGKLKFRSKTTTFFACQNRLPIASLDISPTFSLCR